MSEDVMTVSYSRPNETFLDLNRLREIVKGIQAERDAIASAQVRLSGWETMLTNARAFVPAEVLEAILKEEASASAADGGEDGTAGGGRFSDEVVALITKMGPLSTSQIRDAMTERGYGPQMSGSKNYIYTALSRLVGRGRLAKQGDNYKLP